QGSPRRAGAHRRDPHAQVRDRGGLGGPRHGPHPLLAAPGHRPAGRPRHRPGPGRRRGDEHPEGALQGHRGAGGHSRRDHAGAAEGRVTSVGANGLTVSTFSTGVPNLDSLLGGGLPANTLNILAGEPGTGKTILAQQAMFHYVKEHPDARVLYLTTLSEPAMKVIRYLQSFEFYDPDAFGTRVVYRDVGGFLREHPTRELLEEIVRLVEEYNPALLCIDSFKAIRDLMPNSEEFRRFCYDLSVRLSSAACTTLLLGEYEDVDSADGAEFAVADGIVQMRRGTLNGEPQRMIRVKKLRGQPMNMGEFPFAISSAGSHVYTPALLIDQMPALKESAELERVPTGIPGLDDLLHGGVQRGRSIMLSGVSGSGKTTLALQFLIEGAKRGEHGVLYSFEETADRLHGLADRFGWDLRPYLANGTLRIVARPLTEIRVDENLEQMATELMREKPQ